MESFDGAVLICDITGFTQLTEQLSKQGPSGVEQLTKCMNNYFTKVLCYTVQSLEYVCTSLLCVACIIIPRSGQYHHLRFLTTVEPALG